jgi:hypothetical protein
MTSGEVRGMIIALYTLKSGENRALINIMSFLEGRKLPKYTPKKKLRLSE